VNFAFLWPEMSGYFNACLKELASIEGVRIFVSYKSPSTDAPFSNEQFAWLRQKYVYESTPDLELLRKQLREFDSHVLVVNSWHISAYRTLAKECLGKTARILAMDNPWRATWRQWLGVIVARWYVRPLYDAVFLPGERQAQFAVRLGYSEREIIRGLYACDHGLFSDVYTARGARIAKAFLYVGRLEEEKGVAVLREAYSRYRKSVELPWPLICCGTGRLEESLDGIEGIQLRGFVQPSSMKEEFSRACCVVVPSVVEHWGVIIQEAAAAGLGVICSSACGALPHLVQDGFNGYVVQPNDPDHLCKALAHYSGLTDAAIRELGKNGRDLSFQFTPNRWAQQIYTRSIELAAS
jgi:glycosyltransferase involved in cell wall biosynthesis